MLRPGGLDGFQWIQDFYPGLVMPGSHTPAIIGNGLFDEGQTGFCLIDPMEGFYPSPGTGKAASAPVRWIRASS